MEFLPAGSLADRLDGTPLAPADSARLLESIARATHHAHEAGVIHRDLKPGNILLDFSSESGEMFRPKLSDFGMAKRQEAGNATPTQAILGTPSYMSPEQAFGNSRDVGPTSDVYSLGAILYEVLTGRPPFKGGTPYETLLLTRDEDPVPPRSLRPGIPRDLDTICLKCLEKDPQRRYPSAQSLANDLRAFLDGKPVAARSISRAERLVRLARRHPITATIAVLAILFTLSAMTIVTIFWRVAEAQRVQLVEANQKAKERDDKLLKVLVFSADATSRFFQNPTLASKLDRGAIIGDSSLIPTTVSCGVA
jgi:serine/threonine protein kinase